MNSFQIIHGKNLNMIKMIILFLLSAIFFILGCSVLINAPTSIQQIGAFVIFLGSIIALTGSIVAGKLDTIIKKLPDKDNDKKTAEGLTPFQQTLKEVNKKITRVLNKGEKK